MSLATTQSYIKEKTKEWELPCDTYGDHVAKKAMIIHFYAATITGWLFALIGGISVLTTGQIIPFAWYLFAFSIVAQGGSFITLIVHIYKQLTEEK